VQFTLAGQLKKAKPNPPQSPFCKGGSWIVVSINLPLEKREELSGSHGCPTILIINASPFAKGGG